MKNRVMMAIRHPLSCQYCGIKQARMNSINPTAKNRNDSIMRYASRRENLYILNNSEVLSIIVPQLTPILK